MAGFVLHISGCPIYFALLVTADLTVLFHSYEFRLALFSLKC